MSEIAFADGRETQRYLARYSWTAAFLLKVLCIRVIRQPHHVPEPNTVITSDLQEKTNGNSMVETGP